MSVKSVKSVKVPSSIPHASTVGDLSTESYIELMKDTVREVLREEAVSKKDVVEDPSKGHLESFHKLAEVISPGKIPYSMAVFPIESVEEVSRVADSVTSLMRNEAHLDKEFRVVVVTHDRVVVTHDRVTVKPARPLWTKESGGWVDTGRVDRNAPTTRPPARRRRRESSYPTEPPMPRMETTVGCREQFDLAAGDSAAGDSKEKELDLTEIEVALREKNFLVKVNHKVLAPEADYHVSDRVLCFHVALDKGDKIHVARLSHVKSTRTGAVYAVIPDDAPRVDIEVDRDYGSGDYEVDLDVEGLLVKKQHKPIEPVLEWADPYGEPTDSKG